MGEGARIALFILLATVLPLASTEDEHLIPPAYVHPVQIVVDVAIPADHEPVLRALTKEVVTILDSSPNLRSSRPSAISRPETYEVLMSVVVEPKEGGDTFLAGVSWTVWVRGWDMKRYMIQQSGLRTVIFLKSRELPDLGRTMKEAAHEIREGLEQIDVEILNKLKRALGESTFAT